MNTLVGDITVQPNLTLDGDLQVSLFDDLVLTSGMSFQIIAFNSDGIISGEFANAADGDIVLTDDGVDLFIRYDFDGLDGDDGVYLQTDAPSMPPANDNWISSISIPNDTFPQTLTGSNVDGSIETNEQQLGNTGSTVWWFVDFPEDGTVTIDTFNSDFDTQLHIHEFPASGLFADLIPLVNNDDAVGLQSQVTFQATAGQCYEIRVGGFDGDGGGVGNPAAQGNITLTIDFQPIVAMDVFPESFNISRGLQVGSGTVADVQASDDVRLRFNPGFTLNSSEAPFWIEFQSTLDVGEVYEVSVESSANTPGLTYTVESRNYQTGGGYEVIGSIGETFNSDSVETFLTTQDHIDTNGEAELRVGWRQTGFTLLFPWEARIDAVSWSPLAP